MAELHIKTNTFDIFDKLVNKDQNTIYFATDVDSDKVYVYKGALNVVPKLLGLANGGTGATFVGATANSVAVLNGSATGMTSIPSAKGAFYSTGTNTVPKFGILPVSYGGTGVSNFDDGALLVGGGINPIEAIEAKESGYILMSNGIGANPIYAQPSMSWTPGTSGGPKFNYTINGVSIAGAAIPTAGLNASGIVTNTTQTFAGNKTFSGTTKISNTTISNSSGTGALVVNGGVGIGKTLNVGGVINALGGSLKIGSNEETVSLDYNAASDTLTITFIS